MMKTSQDNTVQLKNQEEDVVSDMVVLYESVPELDARMLLNYVVFIDKPDHITLSMIKMMNNHTFIKAITSMLNVYRMSIISMQHSQPNSSFLTFVIPREVFNTLTPLSSISAELNQAVDMFKKMQGITVEDLLDLCIDYIYNDMQNYRKTHHLNTLNTQFYNMVDTMYTGHLENDKLPVGLPYMFKITMGFIAYFFIFILSIGAIDKSPPPVENKQVDRGANVARAVGEVAEFGFRLAQVAAIMAAENERAERNRRRKRLRRKHGFD
jgi:hypothetical protein